MLDKCPDCGSPRFDVSTPMVLLHFDCGSSWEPDPLKCWNQTMTCKDGKLAALTAEVDRLKTTIRELANSNSLANGVPGPWVKETLLAIIQEPPCQTN